MHYLYIWCNLVILLNIYKYETIEFLNVDLDKKMFNTISIKSNL